MSDNTFTRVPRSDKRLYGPLKLLLCGFPAQAQPKMALVLEAVGMAEVPVIWLTEDQADNSLLELLELPGGLSLRLVLRVHSRFRAHRWVLHCLTRNRIRRAVVLEAFKP